MFGSLACRLNIKILVTIEERLGSNIICIDISVLNVSRSPDFTIEIKVLIQVGLMVLY